MKFDVAQAFSEAIDYCAEKLNRSSEQAFELLVAGDQNCYGYFCYGLARLIADYLGQNCTAIRYIFIYGSCVRGSVNLPSNVDLIIWVDSENDTLAALCELLNTVVTDHYWGLLNSKVTQLFDIKIVDDQEVQQRRGYGAVIGSIHTPPIKIWSRATSEPRA